MTTKGTDNRFRSLTVVGESGTPSTPGSGDFKLYVADDGTFYLMDDTGTPTAIGGGGFSDPMTTRGDIIVRNASNVTARLGIGSAGKVLSSDGTDVSWQTPSGGGALVFLGRLTASSSAQLDFTAFNALYETYIFDYDLAPATDNVQFLMRVGTGGGPTYDTGSNYNYTNLQEVDDGTNTGLRSSTGATSFELGNAWNNTATSGHGVGTVTWYGPANGSYHPRYIHQGTRRAAGSEIAGSGAGRYISATAITAIRFFFSSGNIASGHIDCYGKVHA